MTTTPRLVEKDAFLVAGMEITTRPMTAEIPALWQTFAPRIDEVPQISEPHVSYGVMNNFDPRMGTLEYMAGVSTSSVKQLPDGMVAIEIPAQTYAVFEAKLSTIGEVFGHIFNTWLPGSGFEQIKAPYFERYGAAFNPADPASTIEIFIPIRARSQ
jgi:AraC family transcriptional regulator